MDAAPSYEAKVMELIGNIAELLLKKEAPREPFAELPDLMQAEHIMAATGWSPSHTYNTMKRPDFPLANGGEKPLCCFKMDFVQWLKRNVP